MGLFSKNTKNENSKQKPSNITSKKAKKTVKKKMKIPKTVKETIPYYCVYEEDGIIEVEQGLYSKAYEIQDVNYQIAKYEEQAAMFVKYGEFLNSFDSSVHVQIIISNKAIDRENFEAETLLKFKGDNLDELRVEQNNLLKKKIREGQNNLIKEKFLVVTLEAKNVDEAMILLSRLEGEITTNIKKIGSANVRPLSTVERLSQLHDIYNPKEIGKFGNKINPVTKQLDGFDFQHMRKLGLTTKDCIGPESFEFKSSYGKIGDVFFRSMYLEKIPAFLQDNILAELTNTEFRMITSLNIEPVPMEKAMKLVKNQIININSNVIQRQKNASKSGYSLELISPELRETQEEANDLLSSLSSKNQKMFTITLVITHFASDLETLNVDTETLESIARRMVCSVKKLTWQQENGLNASLPIGKNEILIKRTLTTESTAVFMPFVNQELYDRNGGMYYGNNAASGNLIMFNRRNSKNGNGFILGTPGSGKSMSAKEEMLNVLLSSDDDVIVIDPEGEYQPMAELLGGNVIHIAAGKEVYINPLDMDQNYAGKEGEDPITLKSDFLISIFEVILADRYGLSPSQRSIIDRCTRLVYLPYLESFNVETKEYDKSKIPTLVDFYEVLKNQTGYEARNLAEGLEIYATGSLNIFAHQTNVDFQNRFVVYDIKDAGSSIKTLALLVVLDNVWNRIVAGRKKGKYVWFYIDEIYLLFKSDSSATFLRELYKRARKYGGIPTGITQNVSDLLENDIARTMISNCEFIQMLNQAPLDRAQLAELLNISPTQLSYITNAASGEGLIYTGTSIIPFKNELPKNTKMYRAMTTKLDEIRIFKEQERKEKLLYSNDLS